MNLFHQILFLKHYRWTYFSLSFLLILPCPATRRSSDVVKTSLCTSQQRRKYISNETLNNVFMERHQYVSVVCLHHVLLEPRDDVSKGRNNDILSVCLHGVSNKFQMKRPTSQWYVSPTSQWYVFTTSH